MVMGFIKWMKEIDMKECGNKINNREKEKKYGVMEPFLKEILKEEKRMEKV